MKPRERLQVALNQYLGLTEQIKVFTRTHVEPSELILNMFQIDTRYVRYHQARSWSEEVKEKNKKERNLF